MAREKPLNPATLDAESKAMIHQGLGVTQLAVVFGLGVKTVTARIEAAGIAPHSKRAGYDVWRLRDVAGVLTQGNLSPAAIIETIRKMNPQQLPPMLQKEFWTALRSQLAFEKEAGDLWPTDQIAEYIGEVFQIIRLAFLTLPDQVEQKSALSAKQREVIRNLADSKLEEIRVALRERFAKLDAEERDLDSNPVAGTPSLPEVADQEDELDI